MTKEVDREISVRINPTTIPNLDSCPLCNGNVEKVLLPYEFKNGKVVVRNTEDVPGFRCRSCEAEYYDAIQVGLPLDKATLEVIDLDFPLRFALEISVASLEKFANKAK
ncbi:MAG: YgiT-type zinc finger protein [Candidatus Daviesbacteria bacterium]